VGTAQSRAFAHPTQWLAWHGAVTCITGRSSMWSPRGALPEEP
jgi:hypothetical protein